MEDSKPNLPVIPSWMQWLRALGLGPLVAACLEPAHPLLLLGRNSLYVAEPLLGQVGARWGQHLEDPTTLQSWRAGLETAEQEAHR